MAATLPLVLGFALAPAAVASAHPHHHHGHRAHHDIRAHAASDCAGADVAANGGNAPEMRAAVLCLVNEQRTSRGLPALAGSEKLDNSAQEWTGMMASGGGFSHGDDFSARISATGYRWGAAGENIASGFATPAEVVSGWMKSTGHCQNILNPGYANVGTGVVAKGTSGDGPSTWTQDFGRLITARAPSANTAPMNGCPYA